MQQKSTSKLSHCLVLSGTAAVARVTNAKASSQWDSVILHDELLERKECLNESGVSQTSVNIGNIWLRLHNH